MAVQTRMRSVERAFLTGYEVAALGSPRARASVADQLDRLLSASVTRPPGRWRVLPDRAAVLYNAGTMGDLAAILRGPAPVYARGLAILKRILSDGTGPVYVGDGEELARRLDDALAALRPVQRHASRGNSR